MLAVPGAMVRLAGAGCGVSSRAMCACPVIGNPARAALARSVTATVPATTSIISITVTQPSPNQAAAVAILQAAVDTQRRTGTWAGDPVEDLTEEENR